MTLDLKTKVIISILVLAAVFAAGRYSVSSIDTKSKEVVKTDTQKDTTQDTKKTTTIEKTPDGKEITTIQEETVINAHTSIDKTDQSSTSTVSNARKTLNVSGLASLDLSSRSVMPVYGASVSKEILGPVTLGVFGLTNGVIGVSIGLDF